MLVVRHHPAATIFQQIVLPYLSTSSTTRAPLPTLSVVKRKFSSSAARARPPAAAVAEVEYARQPTWDPYAAGAGPSTARQRERTRAYLGLDDLRHGTQEEQRDATAAYERTTAMAIERIIRSHAAPEPSATTSTTSRPMVQKEDRKGKGRATAADSEDTSADILPTSSVAISSTASVTSDPAASTHPDPPFPPIVYSLLQSRQFRLVTLHIFNVPLFALDSELVERVAGYMDRHGASKAARRLRRGRIPSHAQHDIMADANMSGLLQHSPLDAPGVEASLSRQERNTAYHNTHLVQLLHNSSLAGKGCTPPKSFPLPNTSLRQLRALLGKIYTLERTRGFVPDRVTANIILSCWVRCALAPAPDGVRVVHAGAKGHNKEWKVSPRHRSEKQGEFGNDELRKLFDLVSRLFDTASASGTAGAGESDVREARAAPRLSYSRHVKPFVRIFQHGFKERRDRAALDNLRQWEGNIRKRLAQRRVVEAEVDP